MISVLTHVASFVGGAIAIIVVGVIFQVREERRWRP